jgi:hypothetical protein
VRAVASLALPVAVLAALLSAGAATAAASCDQQVLSDWFADGRVDRAYPLECYHAAVESLPSDLRDYTNAQEEIERALQSAARSEPPDATVRTATSASSSVLVPALAVAATGALAGGGVWLARRARSARRHGH